MDMWLHSSKRASLFSVKWRMTRETPQTIPWLNQLVRMWFPIPEAKMRSPSVETMLREKERFFFLARMSAHTMAKGVLEAVEPPRLTCSPSLTKPHASSSVITLFLRLRSRDWVCSRSER